MNVLVESFFHLQFHRLRLAALRVGRPFSSFIGPGIPDILAQKDFLRPASVLVLGFGAGAFRFEPVSLLYLARPLAVSPAPLDTGNFSPFFTERLTCFLLIAGEFVVRERKCVVPKHQAVQTGRQLGQHRACAMRLQSLLRLMSRCPRSPRDQ